MDYFKSEKKYTERKFNEVYKTYIITYFILISIFIFIICIWSLLIYTNLIR